MMEVCGRVRDHLPELVRGGLAEADAAQVSTHVEACAECAAELRIVQALRAHEVAVPAALEDAVAGAVERGRRQPRRVSRGRLAMAATVGFALVTASLLDRPSGEPPETDGAIAGDALTAPVWPAVDEPLMRDGPALYQLSVEELETLLEELES